jgi:hypothetical protein
MWYNSITIWFLHSPLHGMFSGNTMVVGYTGRKSGKAYHLPVDYFRVGDTLLTTSYKSRTWWRNLRGGAFVSIYLQGKDVNGQAKVIEDEVGVSNGLKAIIAGKKQAARIFRVKLRSDGKPEPGSLKQAARDKVIVRTSLMK